MWENVWPRTGRFLLACRNSATLVGELDMRIIYSSYSVIREDCDDEGCHVQLTLIFVAEQLIQVLGVGLGVGVGLITMNVSVPILSVCTEFCRVMCARFTV